MQRRCSHQNKLSVQQRISLHLHLANSAFKRAISFMSCQMMLSRRRQVGTKRATHLLMREDSSRRTFLMSYSAAPHLQL